MADLEFLLRKAVKHGLNYLSISPNHTHPKEGKWLGCYRTVEDNNCQYVAADDPVEVAEKAIRAGENFAKRRREQAEAEKPLKVLTAKAQRENVAAVAKKEAEKEARLRKRRETDDLI